MMQGAFGFYIRYTDVTIAGTRNDNVHFGYFVLMLLSATVMIVLYEFNVL